MWHQACDAIQRGHCGETADHRLFTSEGASERDDEGGEGGEGDGECSDEKESLEESGILVASNVPGVRVGVSVSVSVSVSVKVGVRVGVRVPA